MAAVPSPFPVRLPAHALHHPVVAVDPAVAATVRATTTTSVVNPPPVADPLPTAASPAHARRGPAPPRVVAGTVLPHGGGRQATSGAAPATVVALGATLSHPAGRALVPLPLAPARRVLAVARSILPLRTPVVGAVRGRLAGPAEATAATTSATVGPGLPKTESSKHSQFSYCPYVLFYA